MQAPSVAVLLLLAAGAGVALQMSLTARWRPGQPVSTRPSLSLWALALAAALGASIAAFLVPARWVEVALFVRTVCLVGSGVMTPFVLASVEQVRFPRWAQVTVLGSAALRVALWPTTDLVFAHSLDAAGNPEYGPLLTVTTAPIALVSIWIAVRAVVHASPGRDRWILGAAVFAAFGVVVVALVLEQGPSAEALGGLWPIPLLVGIEVLLVARARAQQAAFARYEADRVALTARLSQANEELGRTLRLRENLLAVTSHELRTPLTPLKGALETLQHRGEVMSADQRSETVDLASRNAQRMETLVDGLLTASQARSGLLRSEPSHVELGPALEDAVAGWDVELRIDAAPLLVVADRTQLVQIVTNLVSNAHKYGAPPVRIEARTDGAMAVVAVSDAGEGVPEQFVPELFEPFTQASVGDTRTASGVGLGLSISRALAELQGGTLEYLPADGLCRFVLCVPLAPGPNGTRG